MKTEKQELVLAILNTGKYRVDKDRGIVQSYKSGIGEWVDLKGNILPSGHVQHILFLGRHQEYRSTVYRHILVYLSVHGMYQEGLVINHKDLDKNNCSIDNLEAVSMSENISRYLSKVQSGRKNPHVNKIRSEEIKNIKRLLNEHPEWSKAKIARELNLDRVSVGRIINKIQNGEILKYEK